MKLIFNPFERFRENQLLIFGTIITLAGSLLAWIFKARYDGILDVHFSNGVLFYQPFLDNIINILSGALLLFLAGLAVNRKTRFIDILIAIFIARTPLYILPFFNAGNFLSDATEKIMSNISGDPQKLMENINVGLLAIFGVVTILFVVWFFTLLYNGYRVASNAKGAMPVILFILSVIFAEVLSKWLIVLIS